MQRPNSGRDNYIVVSRGEAGDCKKLRIYEGVMHTVTFRSEDPIKLAGVQFFGPKCSKDGCETKEMSNLICYIEVAESDVYVHEGRTTLDKYMSEIVYDVRYGRTHLETIPVIFKESVHIPSNTWVDVRFEIVGPKLHCLSDKALNQMEAFAKDKSVSICMLRGSHQLSGFIFEKE